MLKKNIVLFLKLNFDFSLYTCEQNERFGNWSGWTVEEFLRNRKSVNDNLWQPIDEAVPLYHKIFGNVGLKDGKDYTINTDILPESPNDLYYEVVKIPMTILNPRKFLENYDTINKKIKALRHKVRYITFNPFTLADILDIRQILDRTFIILSDYYEGGTLENPIVPFRNYVLDYFEEQIIEPCAGNTDVLTYHMKSEICSLTWKLCLKLMALGYLEKTESDSQVTILTDCSQINSANFIKRSPLQKHNPNSGIYFKNNKIIVVGGD